MKDQPKVTKNREIKQKVVASLADKVGRAKTIVFTEYKGMTHKQIEALKKAAKAIDAEFAITKNTLLTRALSEKKVKLDGGELKQQTATLFAYADPIAPLKELQKTIKALKLPVIRFGIFEGNVVSEADVMKLANLPSREVLIAQIVGGMKSPIYGLHRALSWNLQKLAMTLQAIADKKPAA